MKQILLSLSQIAALAGLLLFVSYFLSFGVAKFHELTCHESGEKANASRLLEDVRPALSLLLNCSIIASGLSVVLLVASSIL